MRIRFSNFWEGFSPANSLVGRWCDVAFGDFATSHQTSEMVNLDITSNFSINSKATHIKSSIAAYASLDRRLAYRQAMDYGIPMKHLPALHRVWYTGENLRPPTGFDLTLSSDLDEYGGNNIYAPHWIEYVSSDDPENSNEMALSKTRLLSARTAGEPRLKFCAVVMSNPHPLRLRAIDSLRSIGTVDIYGRGYDRPIEDKISLLQNYRFCLAFENDLYPGYVTEKIFDSWNAGCIPLWWGSDPARYINPDALINLATHESFNEFVEAVSDINSNADKWRQMVERPLLLREYDDGPIIQRLRDFA
jgi:hypothetical protein